MDDDLRAQLDAINDHQVECETLAAQDAHIRAVHDLTYLRLLKANGLGPVAAVLLTAVRAATD